MSKQTFIENFAKRILIKLSSVDDYELYYYVFEDGKCYVLPENSDVERVKNESKFLGIVPLSLCYWERKLSEISYYVDEIRKENIVSTTYSDVVIAPFLEKEFKFLADIKEKKGK